MDAISGAVPAYGPISKDEIKRAAKVNIKESRAFHGEIGKFIKETCDSLDNLICNTYATGDLLKHRIEEVLEKILCNFAPKNKGELFLKIIFQKSDAARKYFFKIITEDFVRLDYGVYCIDENCAKQIATNFIKSVKHYEPQVFNEAISLALNNCGAKVKAAKTAITATKIAEREAGGFFGRMLQKIKGAGKKVWKFTRKIFR